MAYQVLARKYRPRRFEEVVGQDHVTRTLRNAIELNRIAHAYLFVGPRGTGKTTLARIFAKCLNCTGGPRTDFPDDDPRCVEIAEGRSLDVLEIDGASNRGIQEIRELRETARYAPAAAPFKIYIIDEVHMLTTEAFNALLKTLEEPPAHVKFMFATTEPEKVLATILSRCQRFDLQRIPTPLIASHLARIAEQEEVRIDEKALLAIARGSDGGMRDAESTLDQLISFCGREIHESDVLSMFGLASQGQILELSDAILQGDVAAAFQHLHTLASGGKDLIRLLGELVAHFRHLLIFRISQGDRSLLDLSETEWSAVESQANHCDTAALGRILDVLTDCDSRIRDAATRRILLELAVMNAIEARSAVAIDDLLGRLQELRTEPTAGTQAAPRARPSPQAEPPAQRSPAPPQTAAPTPTPTPSPAPRTAPATDDPWESLLAEIQRARPIARGYFNLAHPIRIGPDHVVIGFDPAHQDQLSLVDNARTREIITTAAAGLGWNKPRIEFRVEPNPKGAPAPEPDPHATTTAEPLPPNPEDSPTPAERRSPPSPPKPIALDEESFKNDPLIQKALELFKGQIVDIR